MRNAIAAILAAATLVGLSGCESNAGPNTASMLRYQVDASRDRSWWLTREGVVLRSASEAPKAITLPGWIWVDAPHCPPDLALGPQGEVLITSNVVPTVWRIDPRTLAVTVHSLALDVDADKDVGFAALVYSAEQLAFIAYSDVQRSTWKVDATLQSAVKIGSADLQRSRPPQRTATPRLGTCADLTRRLEHLVRSID